MPLEDNQDGHIIAKTLAREVDELTLKIRRLETKLEDSLWAGNKANTGLRSLYEALKVKTKQLESLSVVDVLTNLLNKRGFDNALMREIALMKREETELAVLVIDLDDFKKVNDSLGRSVGDVVIKGIAQSLNKAIRKTDYIARTGSDEFAVLLPKVNKDQFIKITEKIRLSISHKSNVFSFGNDIKVSGSMAAMMVTKDCASFDDLIPKLSHIMEKSKKLGKNCISFEDDNYIIETTNFNSTNSVEDTLSELVKESSFYGLIQEIVDLYDRKVIGYEVLCRSRIKNFENPLDFLRLANENNILTLIDHHCFKACLKATQNIPPNMHCNLNLFISTLMNVSPESLLADIEQYGRLGSYCIELNEQQVIGDYKELLPSVQKLKKAGIQIAIDDVGYGRTCLETIILLEPDILKIDKAFVIGIERDSSRTSQLKRLITMLDSLEIKIIAEGIENNETYKMLQYLGVRLGQGFYFGKPFLYDGTDLRKLNIGHN